MQDILIWLKKYAKDITLFVLVSACIGLICFNFYYDRQEEQEESPILAVNNDVIKDEVETEEVVTKLNIDVKGAVKNPGVYTVDVGSIINDVINLAGGFNSNAYKNGINLSKKVADEMVIYVYTKTEIKDKEETVKDNINDTCNAPTYDICDCVEDNKSIIESKPEDSSSKENLEETNNPTTPTEDNSNNTSLVNINTATVAELTTIKGIGESKAQAIISYRTDKGPFKSINDLLNVSGIGDALFDKIKEFITV